jgi:hypothetical protein
MSREANFRPSDLSSIFRNQSSFRYIKRLFEEGDEEIPNLIKKRDPILIITTHQMTALSKPLFESLGSRLFFIEVVRHPLYMIKQHEENMANLTSQIRDFCLQIEFDNQQLPYYALGYEEKFIEASPIEKGILFIDRFTNFAKKTKSEINKNYGHRLLTISFEDFVVNPFPYVEKIAEAIGSDVTKKTIKEMKRQKVPRKKIADGISLDVYKRFGWEPAKKGLSEKDELKTRYDYVLSKNISKENIEILDSISREYEDSYYKIQ